MEKKKKKIWAVMINTIVSETLLRESELHPQHKTTNNIVNESSKIQRIHSLQKAKLLEINSAGFIFFFFNSTSGIKNSVHFHC